MLVLVGHGNGPAGNERKGCHPSSGLPRGAGLSLPSQEAMEQLRHWFGGVSLGTLLEDGCGPESVVPVPNSGGCPVLTAPPVPPCCRSAPSTPPRESSASPPVPSISTYASPSLGDTSISPSPLTHDLHPPNPTMATRHPDCGSFLIPPLQQPSPTPSSSLVPQQEGVSRGMSVNDQHQVV